MATRAKTRLIPAGRTLALRHRALRPNQDLSACVYPGDSDEHTLHVGAFLKGRLIGIASVYREPRPDLDEPKAYRLRGMAVDAEFRGRGVGKTLLAATLVETRNAGADILWCNARTAALGFYANAGFSSENQRFDIPGIGPHERMWISLQA